MSSMIQLNGNEPSWYSEEDNCDVYTTNFGQVFISRDTERVPDCIIGLGRNQGNKEMTIRILDDEFRVSKDTYGTIWAEYSTPHFPYKMNPSQTIELLDIFRMLVKDDNFSVAAVAVKREFVRILCSRIKLSKVEVSGLYAVLQSWRKPITKEDLKPTRTPIIVRTPIITKTTKGGLT